MQNSTLVLIIIVALIVLGGGWYFYNNQEAVEEAGEEMMEDGEAMMEEEGHTEGGAMMEDDDGASVGASAGADVMVGGSDTEETTAPMSASVSYSSSGFSPSTVTVKVGGTVTWTNQGSGTMWVASAQHPTHTVYAGTTLAEHCDDATDVSFDQCENSSTYSFTFEKSGTWAYHNHSRASHFGTVIVEE